MRLFLIGLAILATVCAQAPSSDYLPPAEEHNGASSNVVESNFLESEPSHSLAEDGYRYKTVKRYRLRHRRDVNELSNNYLPPHQGAPSAPGPVFAAGAESGPAPVFSAQGAGADSYQGGASFDAAASEPAHTLADDGYRYKTVKRYRLRHRRDVNELSNNYLPPHHGAPSAPGPVFADVAESGPAPVFSAGADSYQGGASFDAAASEPAHTLADDGYRYKTVKRYRLRHRRDVNELSNNYLPPHQGAPSAPGPVFADVAESGPAPVFSAGADSYQGGASFDAAASEPAHTLADDGYRYKTVKRYRLRHRRDVNELSNNYLPPHQGAPSAPGPVFADVAESGPAPVFSAGADSYQGGASFDAAASEPAHTLADDGYRYKTVKRYRLRHRRDVNELSNNYLPPHQGAPSAPGPVFADVAESGPAPVFSAGADSYQGGASFDAAASEPAHTLANDGYRYKTVKRYRLRHRRDVNELSNNYLPPHQGAPSAPGPVFADVAESGPAPVFSAGADSYQGGASFDAAASEPAHTLADDGYRYKTVKRYRLRHRRDVNELSNNYLPPHQGAPSAPGPVFADVAESGPAPVFSAGADSYQGGASFDAAASEPAHTLADDGYRYKTVKRYRLRHRRDVNELSNNYLPPHQGAPSAPGPVFADVPESGPVAGADYQGGASFDVAASEPAAAHTLSDDGYRYKTVKRYRYRNRY